MNKKRIAVALSGGIDSSVAALLLKKQGFDVIGISAKTTNTPEACQVISNALEVAKTLDIPFFEFDATKIFKQKVIKYFEDSYKQGITPNPCIMCNKYMKWGVLFDYAIDELKADFIATGHYASIKKNHEAYYLFPASDEHKDQLYFLFPLTQNHLKKTLFPLSSLTKENVRKIAIENNLPSKSSKESQDICFIKPPLTTKKYLNNLFNSKNGFFREKTTGKILGEHSGFWQYTIGQRKGIGIAASEALYVTDIDAATNTVYVGYQKELLSDKLILENINWSANIPEQNFKALVKIRYNMKAAPAYIELDGDKTTVMFENPVSSIAKGQACVLYDINDGHLIGGSFI